MSLFDSLKSTGVQQSQQGNMQDVLNQLKANPAQMLKQRGLNVPDGIRDPQQIIQHLVQSGQVPNQRLQMIQRMMVRR